MASSMIHVAICNEINKKLKRDKKKMLIGTIAPDIARLIGETKVYTHFLNSEDTNLPNINKFLIKYKKDLNDDFVLGYYIHLYTDYLWFKYFIPEIYDEEKNLVTKLDGTVVDCHGQMAMLYIYNDYTNLNSMLVEKYKLDLGFLYDEIPDIKNIIKEAHIDKINLIINKSKEIYENSKIHKDMTFNINNIDNFINLSVELILASLEELKVI